jgi:hypothetical protein
MATDDAYANDVSLHCGHKRRKKKRRISKRKEKRREE